MWSKSIHVPSITLDIKQTLHIKMVKMFALSDQNNLKAIDTPHIQSYTPTPHHSLPFVDLRTHASRQNV